VHQWRICFVNIFFSTADNMMYIRYALPGSKKKKHKIFLQHIKVKGLYIGQRNKRFILLIIIFILVV